jgi:hypothetical protein
MFEFRNVEAPQKLNKDFILSKISDVMIMGYYFGEFKIGDVYHSKFRKDRKASTGFYISKSGKIIYNDLSTGEKADAFQFVQNLYKCDFKTAVQRIAEDFGLLSNHRNATASQVMEQMKNFDRKHKKRTKINFKATRWTDDNLMYWKQYHITKQELEREGVYPIKSLYINEVFIPNKDINYRYALTLIHKKEMLTKVLSPYDADLKWLSSIPLDIPFGLDSLPYKSDKSFGAKAQKDRIIILKFLTDVYANQNETSSAFSKNTKETLFFNYSQNYLGWDNDETGKEGMTEMEIEGFIPVPVPDLLLEKYGIKDWSDLAKERGLKAVEKLLIKNRLL